MSPYMLEDVYERMGRPPIFWPAVGVVMLCLFFVGGIEQ
jgi:hypothetical protein